MKERPILFNGAMVRAILDGRKTQTRRAVKLRNGQYMPPSERKDPNGWKQMLRLCPYGQPGDRLWVRETWQGPILESDEHFDEYRESPDTFKKPGFCVYRATDTLDAVDEDGNELGWRPSIYMPRWASRILLEIVRVRVERLNDMRYEDAIKEGCEVKPIPGTLGEWQKEVDVARYASYQKFQRLWESINGHGSWQLNPWVWVVEFKRVKGGAA